MDAATEELIKAFGHDEERGRREREKAPIAALLIDRQGRLLEDNAVAISSVAWALPLALQQQLGVLGSWSTVEPKLVEQLEERVRRADYEGKPLPIDMETVQDAFAWLVAQLKLPSHLVEPPSSRYASFTTSRRRRRPNRCCSTRSS